MKKNSKNNHFWEKRGWNRIILIFPAVLLVLSCSAPASAGLVYSGSVLSEEDVDGRFQQRESHGLSLQLRQEITTFLSVIEAVRYSYQRTEPQPINERLSPSVDVLNENPFLRLNLSVSGVMALENEEKLADNGRYEMGLQSKWRSDLVPAMQVVASRRKNGSNVELGRTNQKTTTLATTLNWKRGALAMYYNQLWAEDDNLQNDQLETNESQLANLEFNKLYWDKKLQVGFRQNYNNSKRILGATITGLGLIPQNILEVRTGIDNTPADSFDELAPGIPVPQNPQLQDLDLLSTAYSVANNSSFNNILLAVTGQTDQIHLYTRTNLGASALTGLTWALFTNDILGTAWNVATPTITGVNYNSVMHRFEIDIASLSVNYLKLVLDISLTGSAIDFTEVQVFDNRIVTVSENSSQNTSSQTSLNLGGRLSESWSFNCQANLSNQEVATAELYEQVRFGQGIDLKYSSQDKTFFSAVAFTNATVKQTRRATEVTESGYVTYSVDLEKHFLPTLSAGLGWDIREFSLASVRLSETTTYRLDSHAQLYPDLDLNIRIDVRESQDFQNSLKTSSNSGSLTLTSRLKPSLFLSFTGSYTDIDGDASQGFPSSISMQWRPSEDLSFGGTASYVENPSLDYNSFSSKLTMDLVVTENVVLNGDYSTTRAQNVSQLGKLSMQWLPKRGLRFEGGCRYSHVSDLTAENDFMAFGRVVVSFSLP